MIERLAGIPEELANDSRARPHMMVVTSGWFGLGHIVPIAAAIRELKKLSAVRVSLFTLPHEDHTVRLRYADCFDHIYLAEAPNERHYLEYSARTGLRNRQRLNAIVDEARPDLILTHWRILTECVDAVVVSRVRVVAVLEETQWGDVTPGASRPVSFLPVDEVIFADAVGPPTRELAPGQHRVGALARAPHPATRERRLALGRTTRTATVVVSSGGGAYWRSHDLLRVATRIAGQLCDLNWIFLLGPLVPADVRQEIKTAAPSNAAIVDNGSLGEIANALESADLALHAGGVSATAECLDLGLPFVVVNPTGDTTSNDHSRTLRLSAHGVCDVLTISNDVEGELTLAAAVKRALARGRELATAAVSTEGDRDLAALLDQWLREPVEKRAFQRTVVAALCVGEDPSAVESLLAPTLGEAELVVLHASQSGWSAVGWDLEFARVARLSELLSLSSESEFYLVIGDIAPEKAKAVLRLPLPSGTFVVSRHSLVDEWLLPVEGDGALARLAQDLPAGQCTTYVLTRCSNKRDDAVPGYVPGRSDHHQ